MLVEAYGDLALSEATGKTWFQRFRDHDFDVRNEERGGPPKKFEDSELQAILGEESKASGSHVKCCTTANFRPLESYGEKCEKTLVKFCFKHTKKINFASNYHWR